MPLVDCIITSYIYDPVSNDIKEGNIATALLKPMHYVFYQFMMERGWKTMRVLLCIPVMVLIYPVFAPYLRFPEMSNYAWWILPVFILGIILYFLFSMLVGFAALFTTQANWLTHGWWMITNVATGTLAPIVFYPEWLQNIISYTPFPLLLQTPILVLQKGLSVYEIEKQCLIGSIWIVILYVLLTFLWKKGVRRLENVGL